MNIHLPAFATRKSIRALIYFTLVFVPIITILFGYTYLKSQINNLQYSVKQIREEQNTVSENLNETLFEEHLKLMNKEKLEFQLNALESELNNMKNDESLATVNKIQSILTLYEKFKTKVKRNTDVKLDTSNLGDKSKEWGNLLINKDLDGLIQQINDEIANLDKFYNEYLASIAPPPAPMVEGYSRTTVNTERGTFGVYLIKVPFSSVRVKTLTAENGDCSNNCDTKSLEQYVKDNNGFAGMNGAYFCPPDYSSCAGKVNSSDYALYDSNEKNWENEGALSWSETGLVTFNGTQPHFYKKSSEYDGDGVTAGISNYPSLLKDGEVVVDSGDLTSYQKDIKGTRGAIGLGGENLYLAVISNATVIDAAYVMRALGAKNALNLDGGGSTAMYINGGYIIGPGRSLQNAIVLVK